MPCCSTVNIPRRYIPTSQSNSSIPPEPPERNSCVSLRNGNASVLGIFALLKLGRFSFRVRDRTRLIPNRQVYALLCHLVVFIGVMSGFTADATDPLRVFESLTPCFLVNLTGTHTALFPDSPSQPAGAPAQKLPRFAPRQRLLVLPF